MGHARHRPTDQNHLPCAPASRMAVGTINPAFEQSQVFAVLPEEIRETVLEQWYSLQEKPGVAFIINVTDPAVAHELLEKRCLLIKALEKK
jgi:hypothetical protein